MIGAIAGGNTVVIKPSENAPKSAVVIQEVVEASLDPSCYTVVQGGVPETQALLAERWDKIFFTGGASVGRIVAKAAAPHLTPVVLELGGINPAIVTKTANPKLVARRMLWGKTLNAGQVCTSHNYLLADRAILPAIVEEFKKAYDEFYPKGAKASPDYSRIINQGHFNRLKSMIDNSKGKILLGGTMDEKELFIEPTLVEVNAVDDAMLIQESFGPLMPILPVDDLEEAVNVANGIQSTPLGIYPFGSKKDTDRSKLILRVFSFQSGLNPLTSYSPRNHPLRWCFSQRCRPARSYPSLRRCRRKWLWHLPWPRQFRHLRPPPSHHQQPQLARIHPGNPLPALRRQDGPIQGCKHLGSGL